MSDHAPAPLQPLAVSVVQAAEMVGISRTLMFQVIARGEIRTAKIGRRRVIPVDALATFLAEQEAL